LSPGNGYDLTYDAWNRLVEVAVTGGSVVASYAYDGASRRVTKTGSDTRHYYYDDQWRVVEERLNTATTADRRFVWGVRRLDDLILRDTSTRLYALDDKINVTAVVDTSGTVQERYGYNGFGGVRYMDASFATITASAFDWETLFDSYRYDTDTGFYQVRYRYLHPLLGRWITRDPLGDLGFEEMRRNQQPILGDRSNRWSNINRIGRGADSSTINIPPEFVDSIHHPYGFVDNNPQGSIDSLGLDRWMVFGPWIHWHLRVDYWDRCCNKIGQKDIEFLPKSGWREFYALSLAGQISGVDGKVNIMTDGGDGWAYAHRHTTCIQDKGLLAAAEFVQADPPRYYLELFNCHDFALELFNLP
jgi:RHS repeat-associated protein